MKRFVLAAVLAVLCAIPGGAALATGTPPNCKYDDHYTTTTTLTNHPDSGNHGTWATDDFKRVVKICEVGDTNQYHATVEDNGHFTTIAGAPSPHAGVPIKGTVTGEMWGGFTADFTAAPKFTSYTGTHGDTTSTWVQGYFSDFNGKSITDDWRWTYRTDCEKWKDWADNGGGSGPHAGDITGCTCPTPSPSPTETPSPKPSESPSPSPSATPSGGSGSGTTVTAAAEGTTPGLPSTGLASVS